MRNDTPNLDVDSPIPYSLVRTYVDEDDVERCVRCRHACRMHEQICFGQDWGWTTCTCGLNEEL